ncbi:MFS transporter [Pseudonocardia broussonetiae]|uniref:Putative proline/betaine transporter n=1 Tax=Pseudonocardia broussonetiae TaxID=2736640 RepID=A0A6M6JL37_9PSEU|nr:MFS transporter [Pseudonocardia broussonetiae]QJY48066.1 MFS transporter [Pseudonocardia broussonetiae]
MDNAVPAPSRARRRAVAAICIGNFVEWFDFGVYAVFATIIAQQFFPAEDPLASLLATFAVFGVAYVARPFGAIVFGHFGDRVGRRDVLAVVMVLMALSTAMIGLTPNYASIGIAAPVVLALARALQGFSVGGEWGGAASFLAEHAPPHRRGAYGGLMMGTLMLGILAGAVCATLLTLFMPADALASWGWRIPFLLALPLGAVGLYLRLKLEESPRFREVAESSHVQQAPLVQALRVHWRAMLRVVGIAVLVTSGTYLLGFLISYSVQILRYDLITALAVDVAALAACVVMIAVTSQLSDRYGRVPLLRWSGVALLVLVVPLFLLMGQGPAGLVVGQVLLGAAVGSYAGPITAAVTELFPTDVRYSGLSLSYSVATSVFGGTTPLIVTFLLQRTGDPLAPGWFIMATAAVSVSVAFLWRETARDALADVSESPHRAPADRPVAAEGAIG